MHLQKGSVHCIWSRASRRSSVMDFGVGWLSGEVSGCVATGVVGVVSGAFRVQLLVWKAGPSVTEAVSLFMVVLVGETSLKRQSAALFLAPDIHSKVMLWVASSRLHLLTLLFAFFPFRSLAKGLWSFLTMMLAPWR